jgi:multiple sugar transport system ATP-binding protein
VTVGFRPEAVRVVGPEEGLPVVVNVVEQLGSDAFLYTKLAGRSTDDVLNPSDIVVRTEPHAAPRMAETVWLGVREGGLHVFDPTTELRVD